MPSLLARFRPAASRAIIAGALATTLALPTLVPAGSASAAPAGELSSASQDARGKVPSHGLTKIAGAGDLVSAGYGSSLCLVCQRHHFLATATTPQWTTGVDGQGRIVVTQRRSDRAVVVSRHTSATAPARHRRTLTVPKGWRVGGVHLGSDDHLYVAAGRSKGSESKSRLAIQVRRYSPSLRLLSTVSVPARVADTHQAFRAGNGSMTVHQGHLWLAVPQLELEGGDGLNHQAGHLFRFDFTRRSAEHVNRLASHSFGQFIASDGSRIVSAEHGDAYPRAMTVASHFEVQEEGATRWTQNADGTWKAHSRWWESDQVDVLKISGREGDNFTGATLNGFALTPSGTLTTGLSQPQKVGLRGLKGNKWQWRPNVWIALGDPATGTSSFRWITTEHPTKGSTAFGQPRLTQVASDRFVLLFGSQDKRRVFRTHFVLLDSAGRTVRTQTFTGEFDAVTAPVLQGKRLVWINQFRPKRDEHRSAGLRLSALDVANVNAPRLVRR